MVAELVQKDFHLVFAHVGANKRAQASDFSHNTVVGMTLYLDMPGLGFGVERCQC